MAKTDKTSTRWSMLAVLDSVMAYMTGAEAAELTGKSIAEIDEAAAIGVIPAKYQGWQLLVDIDVEPPKKPTKKAAAPKKTAAKKTAAKR